MLETKNLTFVYGTGTPFERVAVNEVSFQAIDGEIHGLMGHTGSGKSTLIQHLNGLLKPVSGQVLLNGKDIWEDEATGTKKKRKVAKSIQKVRFQVGLVFQYPEYQLFEETVAKDIAFGVRNSGVSESLINDRVFEAMDAVGLQKSLSEKSPFELSGGQKRRVAIAGVIAMRPSVLILDEPTAGLDPVGRTEILQYIKKYRDDTGATCILVTHSMEDIARTVDRITVLSKGKVVMSDTPVKVFSKETELNAIGLSVPTVTQVLRRLRAKGIDIDDSCFTLEAAITAYDKVRKGGVNRA